MIRVISFHSDFDGCVSATLVYDYLMSRVRDGLDDPIFLEPVDYVMLHEWKKKDFSQTELWVLDFEDHPHSSYWFDHHSQKQSASVMPSRVSVCCSECKSCGGLLFEQLQKMFAYCNSNFFNLVKKCDVIDSCSFCDPEEILEETPEMKLSWILKDPSTKLQFRKLVVETLFYMQGDVDFLVLHPEFQLNWNRTRYKIDSSIDYIKNESKVLNFDGGIKVATCLVTEKQLPSIILDSSLVSYVCRDCHYVLLLAELDKGSRFRMTFSRSIFQEPVSDFDIGALFRTFTVQNQVGGGGGHRNVGGAVLPTEYKDSLFRRLVALLRSKHSVERHVGRALSVEIF